MVSIGKLKIKTQLILLAFTTIFIVSIFILYTFNRFEKIFTQKNYIYTSKIIDQIKKSINTDYIGIKRIIYNIEYNKDVQLYLVESDPQKKQILFDRAVQTIRDIKNLEDGIVDIVVIDNNKHIIELADGSNYLGALDKATYKEREIYFSSMIDYNNLSIIKKCFILRTDIYSVLPGDTANSIIGLLLVFIDVRSISGNIGTLYNNTDNVINLIDRNGYIFASNISENIGSKFKDLSFSYQGGQSVAKYNKQGYIINNESVPEIGCSIISIIPRKKLLYDIFELKKLEWVIFLFTIIILAIPFVLILNNILHPINRILSYINEIKSGNLKTLKKRINVAGNTEMSIMTIELNNMMDEIESLTQRLLTTNTRLYESELQKNRSELAYLQSQINPHFLYNTLECIKGIAIEEGIPKIRDITKALASIFKYSVKGSDIVTLQEELATVKSYILIQTIRFDDRFKVSYNFNEDLLRYVVPKMILQPVVENSIIHGLEPIKRNGLLELYGNIDKENNLVLVVKDNGKGIEQNTLDEITLLLKNTSYGYVNTIPQKNVGLINVDRRLKLMYGDDKGIKIICSQKEGTIVEIRLPAKEVY